MLEQNLFKEQFTLQTDKVNFLLAKLFVNILEKKLAYSSKKISLRVRKNIFCFVFFLTRIVEGRRKTDQRITRGKVGYAVRGQFNKI